MAGGLLSGFSGHLIMAECRGWRRIEGRKGAG